METSAAAAVVVCDGGGAMMHSPLFIYSCYSYATLHLFFYYAFRWRRNTASQKKKADALTAEVCWHSAVRLNDFKCVVFRSDFDAVAVQQTAGRRWLGLRRSLLAVLSTCWMQTWASWYAHNMEQREALNMFQHELTLWWHLDGT